MTARPARSCGPTIPRSRTSGRAGPVAVLRRAASPPGRARSIIGALDGRLIAIDARTGKEVWAAQTFEPNKDPYSITGAPRVYDGKVVIGNGGADYGSRGFVSAWDAETGKKLWKFYIVPTDPAERPGRRSFRQRDEDRAADLVRQVLGSGRRRQCLGQLRLRSQAQHRLYRHRQRRAAHVALPQRGQRRQSVPLLDRRGRCRRPANTSGTIRWCPEEDWDFTCTQPIVLADIKIDGQAAQGRHAGAQERLLLCDRPQHRQADLRQDLCLGQHLGEPIST